MPGNIFFVCFKRCYKHKGSMMNGILCNEEIQVLNSAEVSTCLGPSLSLMRHIILIFRLQSLIPTCLDMGITALIKICSGFYKKQR